MTGQTVNYSISGFDVTRTLIEPWNDFFVDQILRPTSQRSANGNSGFPSFFLVKDIFYTLRIGKHFTRFNGKSRMRWMTTVLQRVLIPWGMSINDVSQGFKPHASPSSDFHFETSVRRQFHQIHIQRQYWTIEAEENRKTFRVEKFCLH